jgi:very-short-patch-repair endonuclease
VTKLQDEVRVLVRCDGVVARRAHPDLSGSMDAMVKSGELAAVLPGVYAPRDQTDDFRVKVAALRAWSPDGVLTGAAAARLTFWPSARVTRVSAAVGRRGSYAGFRLETRKVPDELVLEQRGLRMTTPALTALDLCDQGTEAIDEVLRTGAASLTELWRALELTSGRRGNQKRLRDLLDSRDEPWSAAERLCHRLLREAGISGWHPNLPVWAGGHLYHLDVAFPEVGLVVEIDGRLHEDDPQIFERDRWRQNALVLDGWVVVRFTWTMLTKHPETVLSTIAGALEGARAGRPTRFRQSIDWDAWRDAQRRQ